MFSGIVAEVGRVESIGKGRIRVRATKALKGTRVGSSVAINGVCLTAARVDAHGFSADVMPETMRATSLGRLKPGDPVNVEPALLFGAEVGGHLVQGHVDATGEVVETREEGNARWIAVRVPPQVAPYCVIRGSLAVDGTSLTIAAIENDLVALSLIPHTLKHTVAGGYRAGTIVNLEADMLAKYVAQYVGGLQGPTTRGGHRRQERS